MIASRFEYAAPGSVAEAVRLLSEDGAEARVMAGGTDLLIKIRNGALAPRCLVGLKRIPGLDRIDYDENIGLTIGAAALLGEVAAHPEVNRRYPGVAFAACHTATAQIRNMGTVVGNLCNASPSADNAPTLLALGAVLTIEGPEGTRQLPLEHFFKGPGLNALTPAEVVTAVCVPPPVPLSGAAYQFISARGKLDCAAVGVGAMVALEGEICTRARIFIGACGPTPMRAAKAEALLKGAKLNESCIEKAGMAAPADTLPITDVRASERYRLKMVAVMTMRALFEARKMALSA
jgi:carbon-monoxide dehydrogenase medium subunit